jgi:branched-chain amino acid transport system substrate-binding protein
LAAHGAYAPGASADVDNDVLRGIRATKPLFLLGSLKISGEGFAANQKHYYQPYQLDFCVCSHTRETYPRICWLIHRKKKLGGASQYGAGAEHSVNQSRSKRPNLDTVIHSGYPYLTMNGTAHITRQIVLTTLSLLLAVNAVHAESSRPSVGVVVPLSGYIASIGSAIRNGIELAHSDRPSDMNAVDFKFEDDQHDPKLGLTAYRHLRASAPPRAIMAFGFFFPTVVGRSIKQDQTPVINLSFIAKPAIGNPYIIRAMNHTKQYGEALADFLASEEQLEYPVVTTEYDFFLRLLDDTATRLAEVKPTAKLSVIARVLPAERDFRSIISKLASIKARRIGVFLQPDQLATFMRQAREGGVSAEIFGSDICETAASIESGQKNLEGCVYPDNEVSAEFRVKYRAKYGNEAQLTFAGAAYDMSSLLADYLSKHPKPNSHEIIEALSQVRDRKGVLGRFSFKDDPSFGKFYEYPVAVKKIVNGVGIKIRQNP